MALATSLKRSQPNFTAIIYARIATSTKKLAKIGRVRARRNSKNPKHFRQFESLKIIKMVSFERSHNTTSNSPFIVTIWPRHAVSEI